MLTQYANNLYMVTNQI